MTNEYTLDHYSYPLPEELIAQHPLTDRDQARLMVIDRKKETITHDVFRNLGDHLPSSCHFVLNDSKVIPARLLGTKETTGGQVEIFLLKKLADGCSYEALLRPLKRIKVDEKIIFNGCGVYAQLKDKENRIVRFNKENVEDELEQLGHMPLPPYIKREDIALDKEYYQTVYAKHAGSVAAPTAGLHFTQELLDELQKDYQISKVTLHVNYATFKPVDEQDVREHDIHEEEYFITNDTAQGLRASQQAGHKTVAVGTTACRVLETFAQTKKQDGSTKLFIYPGFDFKMTDILITNFHLPHSTLLMLVYAFGGSELVKHAYKEAIDQKYRFYSYGDAMMII